MSEERWPPAEPVLEQTLRQLAELVEYPATPALAERVRLRLRTTDRPRPMGHWRWRSALAALVVLGLLGLLLLAWPDLRTAVAERLSLRGVTIMHVPAAPTAALPTEVPGTTVPPEVSPTADGPSAPVAPTGLGGGLNLGRRVDLSAVGATEALLLPALPELGQPDELYVAEEVAGMVSAVYAPRPGWPAPSTDGVALIFSQVRGSTDAIVLGKMIGPDTSLERVTRNGQTYLWITGALHRIVYLDANGLARDSTVRLVGSVLLWEQDGRLCRLEGIADRESALRVAASVGPRTGHGSTDRP